MQAELPGAARPGESGTEPVASHQDAPQVTTRFHKSRARHLRLGQRGERLAAAFLEECGLDILVRNYECKAGEIDIVARDDDVLCFIEVKTRRRALRFQPAHSVGREKKRRIVRAARRYLREIGRPAIIWRYDIVEVILGRWGFVREIRYWRRAFSEEDAGINARF